ncbi:MAG: AMP-binding protein [Mycobacteriales bacterium]|nr:AMP-binding protein [Mycobacteriales bacterium]
MLLRAEHAPPPRTLLDVLDATTAAHPDAAALDDGTTSMSYAELQVAIAEVAAELAARGVGGGDRVGVRLPSGTAGLYTAILGVLAVGACYVPVDVDDPEDRARLVFREAGVKTVLGDGWTDVSSAPSEPRRPGLDDDAWVIFTSGSTGTPKGVAVNHRSAAAFVDAEARLFCQGEPLGPDDRVLAGLSVAFDASCEEMWLAWRHGACLVPAPRSLVRSGMDLGPWLVAQDVTVVSTVPTLAALWPAESLESVRLLVFGGEACPPELAERLAVDGREVWNTYGPTEATVVACAAPLGGDGPVRIGLPLDGWDLAVIGPDGEPADEGELVIGGVGLARYLDPAKDAEKYAALPSLGWDRAYRSGDLVRFEPEGLLFLGRSDEQVKLGGRRIELGEVDAALQALPDVAGAAAAVRTTSGGHQVLVGYVVTTAPLDLPAALARLRAALPAALVPVLAEVDELPVRTSGKVDRAALPWPLASAGDVDLDGTAGWVAEQWTEVLGTAVTGLDDDFFAHGGGSLAAAQLVAALRVRFPEVAVADVYASPRLGALAALLEAMDPVETAPDRVVRPVSRRAQAVQLALWLVVHAVTGLRALTWLGLALLGLDLLGVTVPQVPVAAVVTGAVLLVSPPGRIGLAALSARLLLRGVRPGEHPRGGSVHLRLWCAERLVEAVAAHGLACAPWVPLYARLLGARLGRDADLHALPPVTGMLELGEGASVEPEVDLAGHWLDGDVLDLGPVRIGAGARVGTRSTLLPGADVGERAVLLPGSALDRAVPAGQTWAGSPASKVGRGRHRWPKERPPRGAAWLLPYTATAALIGGLPVLSLAAALAVISPWWRSAASYDVLVTRVLVTAPVVAVVAFVLLAGAVLGLVRLLGIRVAPGHAPVRSRTGWQVWATLRLLDEARTWLFPLYSSLLTPTWLRLLGARVGKGVEVSTALVLPTMTTIGDGAFLADDTMVGAYELSGGWLRVAATKIGKRAFLGNSGMTAPGRRVRKDGLVAVLSAAPERAKPGSSWLGSPPVRLRRVAAAADESRTFAPPRRLVANRAVVESLRLVAVALSGLLGAGVLILLAVVGADSWLVAALVAGPLLVAAGAVAALSATLAHRLVIGRVRPGEHPLWSSFVWRNELADAFVEVVAAPWFARTATGTPVLVLWLRTMGARIGRGAWCETYWLPEADLVTLGAGSSVGRGSVVQTHLFHDRVLATDRVVVGEGATLGPHSVVLPAASLGDHVTVGPASLVMRGDRLPAASRWRGNPVAPWHSR